MVRLIVLVVGSKISNGTDEDRAVGPGGRVSLGGLSGCGFDGAVAVVTGDGGVIGGRVGRGGRSGHVGRSSHVGQSGH